MADAVREPQVARELQAVDARGLDADEAWDGVLVTGSLVGGRLEDVALEASHVRGARLAGTKLSGVTFTDVLLEDADLSGLVLDDCRWDRVELHRCRMTDFVAAGSRLRDVRFVDCTLGEANFRMVGDRRIEFEGCDLRKADFYGAGIDGLVLERCDLTGVELSKAKIPGTRLTGSAVDGLLGAESLRGAVIDSDQAVPIGLALLAGLGILLDTDG